MALLCTRQKASPVASESVWVNACTSNMSAERFTYAATSIEDADVGQSMPAAHAGLTRLATRLWAIDVRKKEDHWELSFVLHTAATSFRLPNFMLKPLLASWISSCLVSIWRMASAQVAPKGPVCLIAARESEPKAEGTPVDVAGRMLSFAGPRIW
ncbi:unnamed protein product [Durusdinium trenchii]